MRNGFSIFDTHTHIGVARHSGRRHSAEQLPAAMDHAAAHDEIARAVRAHPDPRAGCARIYPFIPAQQFCAEVRRCAEELGFRALKKVLSLEIAPEAKRDILWNTARRLFDGSRG